MYDIVIVGAGTAGLSAAIYGVRAGKSVLVLEEKNYGGQIVNSPHIENYPGISHISGYEFSKQLYDQAMFLGAEYKQKKVLRIEEGEHLKKIYVKDAFGKETCYSSKTVIVATGAKNRTLGLDKEQKFIGAGVSYCATCDGMFFRNRDVAVVGGGNTALEDAMFLSNYCTKVYVIHRRNQFRGEEKLAEDLGEKENVTFLFDSVVTELQGDTFLEGIGIKNLLTEKESQLSVSGLFVAIGHQPDNEAFVNCLQLDESGYIVAKEDCKTNTPGIYAAGDCRTKQVRQLTTAASDGAVAALMACEYMG